MTAPVPMPTCCDCKRSAATLFPDSGMTDDYPDAIAWAKDDGTYNRVTNRFCCNECYIKRGCPSKPWPGWKAP